MLSRVSQIHRHLSPSSSLIASSVRPLSPGKMSSANARPIQTAACLIIGDEVLGGKTVDTNSAFMAKWCFQLGIGLKRVEVIEDDEDTIVEAVRRMSEKYDFVVTSGGIGPTHDDLTYPSIAKAFDLPLKLHEEALERMKRLSRNSAKYKNLDLNDKENPTIKAALRMVTLPTDESRDLKEQAVFPHEELWVPVSIVNSNIHILPGVPSLFEKLLNGLRPYLLPKLLDPEGKGIFRVLVSTPLPESAVAAYLTELADKVKSHDVKVGSYPRWGKKYNTVTLVGRDLAYLESLVPEVVERVEGQRVAKENELDDPAEETEKKP